MRPVNTYKERKHRGLRNALRRELRGAAIFAASIPRTVPKTGNWIRFPMYHHVFDDEREGFREHLRFFRDYGDFLSMDDAAAYLRADTPPAGRYFCVTFDDGLKNSLTNAAPILRDERAVAAFFVPTGFIGADASEESERMRRFYERLISPPVEMLTWDECRQLAAAGMTIGSHGISHTRLTELAPAEIERELRESKAVIEKELGKPCRHLSPPFGTPVQDFDPGRDPETARRLAYETFLISRRGSLARRPPPMQVERDGFVALWPTYQLRYFLSR